MSEKPEPCPFCGGEAFLEYGPGFEPGTVDKSLGSVSCETAFCPGNMSSYLEPAKAITIWNTRAIDAASIRNKVLEEAAKTADKYDARTDPTTQTDLELSYQMIASRNCGARRAAASIRAMKKATS